jgi:hypothetical protein
MPVSRPRWMPERQLAEQTGTVIVRGKMLR